jgi:hypothetical protein
MLAPPRLLPPLARGVLEKDHVYRDDSGSIMRFTGKYLVKGCPAVNRDTQEICGKKLTKYRFCVGHRSEDRSKHWRKDHNLLPKSAYLLKS